MAWRWRSSAQIGDVRVIVGCNKTTSWEIATFANTSWAQQSNQIASLRGQQRPQHNAGSTYTWEHLCCRIESGARTWRLGETSMCQFRNQCAFSVIHPQIAWFLGTVSANQECSQLGQYLRPTNPNTTTPDSSSSSPARSTQGRRRSPRPSQPDVSEEEDNDDEEGSAQIQDLPWVSPSSTPAMKEPTSFIRLDFMLVLGV